MNLKLWITELLNWFLSQLYCPSPRKKYPVIYQLNYIQFSGLLISMNINVFLYVSMSWDELSLTFTGGGVCKRLWIGTIWHSRGDFLLLGVWTARMMSTWSLLVMVHLYIYIYVYDIYSVCYDVVIYTVLHLYYYINLYMTVLTC